MGRRRNSGTYVTGSGGSLSALASRLGRHTALYAAGSGIGFVLALLNLAVLTRYLSLAEFGQLALLMVFAALLTILYNLGTLQGCFVWVFGASGEEGGGDDEDEAGAGQKRRALGSGVVLTFLVAAAGTVAIFMVSPFLASIVTGDATMVAELRWAAASGGLGALWRLFTNIPRFERRPISFVVLSTLRPILVLALSLTLVVAGYGLVGAVAGTALGTAAAVGVISLATRGSFSLAWNSADLSSIFRRGGHFVPVILSFWIVQTLDIYLLSLFTSDAEAGLYRVASRLASVVSYFVSAFLMAWMPLSRTAIHEAAVKKHGSAAANGVIITYFLFAGSWLVLVLAVSADLLVKIAAASFAPAASLVPVLACGFLAYGCFVLIYRGAQFQRKRLIYVSLAVVSALVFLAASLLLIPAFGAYGAAFSSIVAFGVASIGILFFSQRGNHPIPLPWFRIGGAGALGGVLAIAALRLGPLVGPFEAALEVLAVLAFPIVVVGTGLLPRDQLTALRAVVRQALPSRYVLREATTRLEHLDAADRRALRMLVRERRPTTEVARLSSTSEPALLRHFVAVLRTVGDVGPLSDADPQIGAYLLSGQPVAERDRMAKRLFTEGVEPLEVDALETTLSLVRRAPRRVWEKG